MSKRDKLTEDVKQREQERRLREEAKQNAVPWIERTSWRKRHMYVGWTLEETLEQVGECAAITRSHCGYRVLNTSDLGFVDVDFNLAYRTWHQEKETLANLGEWVAAHPEQAWRAYRTAGGLRLMRTDAPQPLEDDFDAFCIAVGADDLYRQLCHEQKAFRARLTPKPGRCGIEMPCWNPYDPDGTELSGWSTDDRLRLPIYLSAYDILAQQYKVCELLDALGSGAIHPDL